MSDPVNSMPLLARMEAIIDGQVTLERGEVYTEATPRELAVLLLRAIREPSPAMLAPFINKHSATEVWRGMIDRALTEGTKE